MATLYWLPAKVLAEASTEVPACAGGTGGATEAEVLGCAGETGGVVIPRLDKVGQLRDGDVMGVEADRGNKGLRLILNELSQLSCIRSIFLTNHPITQHIIQIAATTSTTTIMTTSIRTVRDLQKN